jgi:imidazolonepropionase-like amidohydrolase
VAVHATSGEGIRNALEAGADSIEHGHDADRASLELMKKKGAWLVPTIGILETLSEQAPQEGMRRYYAGKLEAARKVVAQAHQLGVKLATGYDASSARQQGDNARELVALGHAGLPPMEVLRAATLRGAELLGLQEHVGTVEPGRFADLIAVTGDPLKDLTELQRVRFVMKGGAVIRSELPAPEPSAQQPR